MSEQKLIYAILQRAIIDYIGNKLVVARLESFGRPIPDKIEREWGEVRNWIAGKGDAGGITLADCCAEFMLDPDDIREQLDNKPREILKKVLHERLVSWR